MKKKIITNLNLPKVICLHVIGKKHSKFHRQCCGVMVMAAGVFVAEILGAICHELGPVAHAGTFMCNVIGYGLHGAGLVPFIEIEE